MSAHISNLRPCRSIAIDEYIKRLPERMTATDMSDKIGAVVGAYGMVDFEAKHSEIQLKSIQSPESGPTSEYLKIFYKYNSDGIIMTDHDFITPCGLLIDRSGDSVSHGETIGFLHIESVEFEIETTAVQACASYLRNRIWM